MGLLDFGDGKLDIGKDEPSAVITVTPAVMEDLVQRIESPEPPTPAMVALMEPEVLTPDAVKARRAIFRKRTGMTPENFLTAWKENRLVDNGENNGHYGEACFLRKPQGRKAALFSSARGAEGEGNDNWGTPAWLYDLLNKNFGPFTVDTCADAENSKVPGSFFDIAADGLKQTWTGKCWCNPPYSGVTDWVKKAYDSVYVAKTAERAVLLVANRTETEWFHEYAAKGLVFFLRSRVKFVEPKDMKPLLDADGNVKKRSSPTFGSIVIVFDRGINTGMFQQLPGGNTLMAVSVDWRAQQKVVP